MTDITFERGEFDRALDMVRRARGGGRDGPSGLERDMEKLASDLDQVRTALLEQVKEAQDSALREIDKRSTALRAIMEQAVDIINLLPTFMRETGDTLQDHSERLSRREGSVLDSRRISELREDLHALREEVRKAEAAAPSDDVVRSAVSMALDEFRAGLPRPTQLSTTLVDEDRCTEIAPADAEWAQLYQILSDIAVEHFWPKLWLEQGVGDVHIVAGWSRQQLERFNAALAEAGVSATTALTLARIEVGSDDVRARTAETGLDAAQACALTLALASGGGGGELGEAAPRPGDEAELGDSEEFASEHSEEWPEDAYDDEADPGAEESRAH